MFRRLKAKHLPSKCEGVISVNGTLRRSPAKHVVSTVEAHCPGAFNECCQLCNGPAAEPEMTQLRQLPPPPPPPPEAQLWNSGAVCTCHVPVARVPSCPSLYDPSTRPRPGCEHPCSCQLDISCCSDCCQPPAEMVAGRNSCSGSLNQLPPVRQFHGSCGHISLASQKSVCTCSFKGSAGIYPLANDGTIDDTCLTIARLSPSPTHLLSDTASDLSEKHSVLCQRRCSLRVLVLLAALVSVGVGVPLTLKATTLPSGAQRMQLVATLLHETPLVDGHNDLPWNLRSFVHNEVGNFSFDSDLRQLSPWNSSRWSHTDLPRLRKGQVGAQFWAAYVPCGSQWKDAVAMTLEQVDVVRRLVSKYPSQLQMASSSHDIIEIHGRGRVACLVGVEGGHSLGNSMSVLRSLYLSGVRYLTLTHTCSTPWATSASRDADISAGRTRSGLTDFGKAVIGEMNRLGMLVDLSHTSDETALDALSISRAPVIFSHSAARTLCNNSRNVPDHLLHALAENDGIIMVSFYPQFVSCSHTATADHVLNHIKYIRNLIGIDHVGLGAGYDGINWTPQGLEDVSRYPVLLAHLLEDPQWTAQDVKKLAGENFLRVFRSAEKVSRQLAMEGVLPSETIVDPLQLIFTDAAKCSYEMELALNRTYGKPLHLL